MYISRKHKIALICVPGSGSNSLREWFDSETGGRYRTGYQHETISEAMADPRWKALQHFKFVTGVRNPYDWVKTFYSRSYGHRSFWYHFVSPTWEEDRGNIKFFLENTYTLFDWATDFKTGKFLADVVVRSEDLPTHKNKTPRENYFDFEITPEFDEIIKRRFYREFEYYK